MAVTIGSIPVLELDLPGATKYYGEAGDRADSIAGYIGKVMAWGNVQRQVSEHQASLPRPEFAVTLDDNDREFAKLIEGSTGDQILGSAARHKLLGNNLAEWTEFTGKLFKWVQRPVHQYVLSLRHDDEPLYRKFPKLRITQFDFPSADSTAIGQYYPIVLGVHDSNADTNAGMLPTYYIDKTGYRYLVSLGYTNVRRVYGDGSIISVSDYAITHPTINGNDVTLVDFTDSSHDGEVITVDLDGYDTDGDGGGTIIENPVTQLEYLMENFIFGDWRSGSWLTSQAPIADTELTTAETFATTEAYEGAIYVAGDQVQASEVVNNWLKSWEARAFWTRDGELAPLFLDHSPTAIYKDGDSWLRHERDDMGFTHRQNVEGRTSRISIRYVKNSVDDQLKQTIEVRDLSIDKENADSLDMEYGPAKVA